MPLLLRNSSLMISVGQPGHRDNNNNNNNNNNSNNKLYFYSVYINNCSRRFTILLKYIKIQFKNYNNKRMNSSTNNNKNNKQISKPIDTSTYVTTLINIKLKSIYNLGKAW